MNGTEQEQVSKVAIWASLLTVMTVKQQVHKTINLCRFEEDSEPHWEKMGPVSSVCLCSVLTLRNCVKKSYDCSILPLRQWPA